MSFSGLLHTISLMIVIVAISGCRSDRGFPQVKAVSPLGKPARCDACGKEIPAVAREHLFSFQGIQYTVCNKTCAAQLEDDIVHDRFGSHEH